MSYVVIKILKFLLVFVMENDRIDFWKYWIEFVSVNVIPLANNAFANGVALREENLSLKIFQSHKSKVKVCFLVV